MIGDLVTKPKKFPFQSRNLANKLEAQLNFRNHKLLRITSMYWLEVVAFSELFWYVVRFFPIGTRVKLSYYCHIKLKESGELSIKVMEE